MNNEILYDQFEEAQNTLSQLEEWEEVFSDMLEKLSTTASRMSPQFNELFSVNQNIKRLKEEHDKVLKRLDEQSEVIWHYLEQQSSPEEVEEQTTQQCCLNYKSKCKAIPDWHNSGSGI